MHRPEAHSDQVGQAPRGLVEGLEAGFIDDRTGHDLEPVRQHEVQGYTRREAERIRHIVCREPRDAAEALA